MANTPDRSPNKTPMSEDERQELRAMIAAGRDLSPEMDDSLVDSYAERRAAEQKAKAKVEGNEVVAQQQNYNPLAAVHPAVAIAGIAAVAAIFLVVMIVSHGWLWWMIFPLMGIFGGWWGRDERHRVRDARRAERYQMRADYYRTRMGLPPREDERRLPESSQASVSPESSEQRDSGPLPPPSSAPTPQMPAPRSIPPASSTPSGGEQPPINPAG